MTSSSVSSGDALCALLLLVVDSSSPPDWAEIAPALYAYGRVLLSPQEAEQTYFAALEKYGGRFKMEHALAHVTAELKSLSRGPQTQANAVSAPQTSGVVGPGITTSCSAAMLLNVHSAVLCLEYADIFKERVLPNIVSQPMQDHSYGSVIHHPLCLADVHMMIVENPRRITSLDEYEQCIWHIAANCVHFNAADSFYPGAARRFAALASDVVRRYQAAQPLS